MAPARIFQGTAADGGARSHHRATWTSALALTFAGVCACASAARANGSVAPLIPESRGQSETCLAEAISYEAGNEPEEGQEAVAQVVLNRLRHPGFPKTICRVVFQGSERRTGCQFTFTCDGSMTRRQPGASWAGAVRIARLALDGQLVSPVGGATHYHAFYVTPAWAAQLTRVGRIGAHIFYADGGGYGGGGAARLALTTASAAPRMRGPAVFSAWGLETAVLVPAGGTVRVRAAADDSIPPRAPDTAVPPIR